jgi:hypothetical protein
VGCALLRCCLLRCCLLLSCLLLSCLLHSCLLHSCLLLSCLLHSCLQRQQQLCLLQQQLQLSHSGLRLPGALWRQQAACTGVAQG